MLRRGFVARDAAKHATLRQLKRAQLSAAALSLLGLAVAIADNEYCWWPVHDQNNVSDWAALLCFSQLSQPRTGFFIPAYCFVQFHDRTEDLNGTSSVSVTLRSVVSATTVLLLVQIFRCHRIEIRLEKVKCRLYKGANVWNDPEHRKRFLLEAAASAIHIPPFAGFLGFNEDFELQYGYNLAQRLSTLMPVAASICGTPDLLTTTKSAARCHGYRERPGCSLSLGCCSAFPLTYG